MPPRPRQSPDLTPIRHPRHPAHAPSRTTVALIVPLRFIAPNQAATQFAMGAGLVWAIEDAQSYERDQVAASLHRMSIVEQGINLTLNADGQIDNPMLVLQYP